jgi:hypothetical protein
MKHIKFTYVDAVTGVSVASEPAANGPTFPTVQGLDYVWARESAYPTNVPEFFGTCPEESSTQVDGVLGVFSQADWETMQADEMAKRQSGVQNQIVAATQNRLDDFARSRNYDGILSTCTYAASTVPKFAAEGQYCVGARDATWARLYEILAEVQAGTRPAPSGFADIEGDLPALVWPN